MSIDYKKLLVVAHETRMFQHTNGMPSVEKCEAFDERLKWIERNKAELAEMRTRTIERCAKYLAERTEQKKPFSLKEMREISKAVGFCIGDKSRVDFLNGVEFRMTEYPRLHSSKKHLEWVEWMRLRKVINARIYGARCELRKMEVAK